MSRLLFDEQPITVDRTLAKLIGFNEAVVIQQLHYWLEINRHKGRNFVDGYFWTYNSLAKWHSENFDFWGLRTVERIFAKLETEGLLISGNYNRDKRDRTKWYRINYQKLEELVESISPKWRNDTSRQNGEMQYVNLHQPLPENNIQRFTTENKQQQQDMHEEVNGDGCRRPFTEDEEEKREPDPGEVEKLTKHFVEVLGIEYPQAKDTARSLLKHFKLELIVAKVPCAVGQTFTKGLGAFLRTAIRENWPVPVKKTARGDSKKEVVDGKYKDIYMG